MVVSVVWCAVVCCGVARCRGLQSGMAWRGATRRGRHVRGKVSARMRRKPHFLPGAPRLPVTSIIQGSSFSRRCKLFRSPRHHIFSRLREDLILEKCPDPIKSSLFQQIPLIPFTWRVEDIRLRDERSVANQRVVVGHDTFLLRGRRLRIQKKVYSTQRKNSLAIMFDDSAFSLLFVCSKSKQ